MKRFLRRAFLTCILLAVAAGIGYAVWPPPVAVEVAVATRGTMRVTVDEDGRTRIKERYMVSAPLAGRLGRIALREGDLVTADETVLALIDPAESSLLDPRARAVAQARLEAAEVAVQRADALLQRANAQLEQVQSELAYLEKAVADDAATQLELDRAATATSVAERDRAAAQFAQEIARFEVKLAQAALQRTGEGAEDGAWRFEIKAPVSGRVLRVLQESASVVQAGTPLIEVGDPGDLELVVDVLSSDGVAIRPGAPVALEHWGGEEPLEGRVRRVEPAAFTKISSLGVEEQRVNVIIDFLDPLESRLGLGDGFRVEARIEVWRGEDVLGIPTGSLFRGPGGQWEVFRIEGGRATIRPVEVGRRSGSQAEILGGLAEGDEVVVYPSDRVTQGRRVVARSRR